MKNLEETDEIAQEFKAKDTKIQKLKEEINALKAIFYCNGAANIVEMIQMNTEIW